MSKQTLTCTSWTLSTFPEQSNSLSFSPQAIKEHVESIKECVESQSDLAITI